MAIRLRDEGGLIIALQFLSSSLPTLKVEQAEQLLNREAELTGDSITGIHFRSLSK